jgi:hypothetical protein
VYHGWWVASTVLFDFSPSHTAEQDLQNA